MRRASRGVFLTPSFLPLETKITVIDTDDILTKEDEDEEEEEEKKDEEVEDQENTNLSALRKATLQWDFRFAPYFAPPPPATAPPIVPAD